jgi:hypothetical protein
MVQVLYTVAARRAGKQRGKQSALTKVYGFLFLPMYNIWNTLFFQCLVDRSIPLFIQSELSGINESRRRWV